MSAICSQDYLKMISVKRLQDVIDDFYKNSDCANSYLHYKDLHYYTDMGYAFDGVYMILDILEHEFNIKLIPDYIEVNINE